MKFLISVLVVILIPTLGYSQEASIGAEIDKVASSASGKLGVSVLELESGESYSLNGNHHFPMQSVYKFPLAMAILHSVDSGKLSLSQIIHIKKDDLDEDTWSPMREKYPNQNIDLSLQEILRYCISYSDNNACDILIDLIGGPLKVQKFVRSMGLKNIAIVATEDEMHQNWKTQFKNWCTPLAMIEILKAFYERKYLSASSSDLLLKFMTESENSQKRIKGLLPEGTVVAHKTGSSGMNKKGIAAATNDVGIITLPNGKHVAIVIYLSMSSADDSTREETIAQIAKVVWDYYSIKK